MELLIVLMIFVVIQMANKCNLIGVIKMIWLKKTGLLGLGSSNGFLTSTLKLAESAGEKSKSLPPSKK